MGLSVSISMMTGFSTVAVMHSPLSQSTSPSDFWGRRWNRMIHAVLKVRTEDTPCRWILIHFILKFFFTPQRGVYLPLRKYFSRTTASIGTFVASGLLHEYVLAIIFLKGNVSPEEQRRNYGMHMAFFAYNGIIVLIEHALKGNKYCAQCFAEIQKVLPKQAIAALVLLIALPVSHWFTDEYVISGFYTDYSLGLPRIVYIPQ